MRLFDVLKGPGATTANIRFAGLLPVAIDGTQVFVADAEANLVRYAKHVSGPNGASGYPVARLVALVSCGTRHLIDAVFAPASVSETALAPQLCRALTPSMLLLGDRNFPSATFLAQVHATGAKLLMRIKDGQRSARLPVLTRLADGTWLSTHGTTTVRVIQARVRMRTEAGTTSGTYRLVTTLLDPDTAPAMTLVRLYHQRWEIETAFCELKSTILHGRVLRARTPAGITQEIYALLIAYQALRTAMTDATNHDPHLPPDRASFTIALAAARDQITAATTAINATTIDLLGKIGAAS